MRFIVRATVPIEAGNDLVRDPNMAKRFETILGDVKPEAAYFGVESGQRTLYMVVNVQDASELPRIAEPFWLSLEADVDFIPVMTQEDFAKAATHIQAAASKY